MLSGTLSCGEACEPGPSRRAARWRPTRCSGDLGEALVHGLDVDLGMMIAAPALRSGQIAPKRYADVAMIARCRDASHASPDACQGSLLTDAGFDLKPDLHRLGGSSGKGSGHERGKLTLKDAAPKDDLRMLGAHRACPQICVRGIINAKEAYYAG